MSVAVRNNLDLALNQLLSAVIEQVAADPATPTAGRIVYNTATSTFKVGNGTTWIAFYPSTTPINQLTAPNAPLSMAAQKIQNLADGVAATDAVTMQQLNNVVAGLDIKASVRAASTANINVATGGILTVDGIALTSNDRVLLKDQTAPAENGIWQVNAGAWTRTTDSDAWTEIPGSIVAVETGTVNADTVWLATADQGGTLGTTGVTWSKIAPAAAGGTGTVKKYAVDITGNGALTQFTVTHNLGSTDVVAQVWEVTTNAWVLVDITRIDANSVRVDFAVAPVNAKVYRVVVTS